MGTRHPLFAPNYVSPLVAATPERRENRVLKQEAAAMLTAADIKRRYLHPSVCIAFLGSRLSCFREVVVWLQ